MTIGSISGSFAATGQSSSIVLIHQFNLSLSGFGSASVNIERSFDNGSTWLVVETYTADAEKRGCEPENGVIYRLNCTSYTSGIIAYRLSK